MIQTLVHKCRYCGQVVLVKRYSGSNHIIELQGAVQYSCVRGCRTEASDKLLVCQGKREKMDGWAPCGREMKVATFKEITL